MIAITVHLLAGLQRHLPDGVEPGQGYPLAVADGARVGDVLAELTLDGAGPVTCLLNGRHADDDQPLQEGDVLGVFPAVGGG